MCTVLELTFEILSGHFAITYYNYYNWKVASFVPTLDGFDRILSFVGLLIQALHVCTL